MDEGIVTKITDLHRLELMMADEIGLDDETRAALNQRFLTRLAAAERMNG